jgi:hypothetical protein
MIEYLYNAIRATAGKEIAISAIIEDNGEPITEGCRITLFDKDDSLLDSINGEYIGDGFWSFRIPAELTQGKCGRHWYRICTPVASLCFKQPIYLCD